MRMPSRQTIATAHWEQKTRIQRTRTSRNKFPVRAISSEIDVESRVPQIATGLPGVGKTTLCLKALEAKRVPFVFLDFSDKRLAGLRASQSDTLYRILLSYNRPFSHMLIRELTQAEHWEELLAEFLKARIRVIATSSKALKTESFEGDIHEIRVAPLSFREVCERKGIPVDESSPEGQAKRRTAFKSYLERGGLPPLQKSSKTQAAIRTVHNAVLDTNAEGLKNEKLALFYAASLHCLDVAPAPGAECLSAMTQEGVITARAASNYVERLKDGFLLQGLAKYGAGPKLLETSERLYPADTAFLALRDTCDAKKLHEDALEIAVFQHLSQLCEKTGLSLQHFADGNQLCGFIIRNGEEAKAAIQCAYDIGTPEARDLALQGLLKAAKGTGAKHLLLLTDRENVDEEIEGVKIEIRPAHEWLLDEQAFASLVE